MGIIGVLSAMLLPAVGRAKEAGHRAACLNNHRQLILAFPNEGHFAVDLSNTGTFDGVGTPTPYWWCDTPGSYHNRGVVLSFADGHVERHQWLEPTTLGPIGVTGPRSTSANDLDIAWLQERTAERR